MVVIDKEKIVEVSSYFLRRRQGGENIKFVPVGKRRKELRHHAHLNFMGDLQLAFDPFLCRRGFFEMLDGIVQTPRHLVERGRERANLLLSSNVDPLMEITPCD